jgi:hypothetical protein
MATMESNPPEVTRNPLRAAIWATFPATLACLLGCALPQPDAGAAIAPELRLELEGIAAAVRSLSWPTADQPLELGSTQVLVLAGPDQVPGYEQPDRPTEAAMMQLRRFVADGGRLLLLGYAMDLVTDLGLEERGPDSCGPLRWGFDDRTHQGRAALGVTITSSSLPQLTVGLHSLPSRPHSFLLTGSQPCSVPLCVYVQAPPANGTVVGNVLRQLDGEDAVLPAAGLIRWQLGRGQVLGLGMQPLINADDPAIAHNARTFLKNTLEWLGSPTDATVSGDRAAEAPKPEVTAHQIGWLALPPAAGSVDQRDHHAEYLRRDIPGAKAIAHWGFVVDLPAQPEATPDGLTQTVLVEQWQAGADLLSLSLTDRDGGYPTPWGERDPILRPPFYRQSSDTGAWQLQALGELAHEAHARQTLVQALIEASPEAARPQETLASLRFLARQMHDRRGLQSAALDGFVLRGWPRGQNALTRRIVQDYRPDHHVVLAGEGQRPGNGTPLAVDADDGRPMGLRAAGISDRFRNLTVPKEHPIGLLDCRARRPQATPQQPGGGSFGDWLLIQANDFARRRQFAGAAMLWNALTPECLNEATTSYVRGISLDPLRSAVATRCTSTGKDGWRDCQRRLLPDVQPGFGAELPVPAGTVMLQNNHLRLYGSGGALVFDPTGTASLTPELGQTVTPALYRTRLFGMRPDARQMRDDDRQLLRATRGEGSYTDTFSATAGSRLPARLAFGAAPAWPQRLDVALDDVAGSYQLDLALAAVSGSGIVSVGTESGPIAMFAFDEGRLSVQRQLPLQFAHPGRRWLRVEVLDGGAIAIERLQLTRTGDIAAEAEVSLTAGELAQLTEHSASTYHREQVKVTAVADLPALLVQSTCLSAANGLQLERVFTLPGYRLDRLDVDEEGLRRPFVLRADDRDRPDLCIVPVRLGRYDHFTVRADELAFVARPRPNSGSSFALYLAPHGEGHQQLRTLPARLQESFDPRSLDFSEHASADLHTDLPVHHDRLLEVTTRGRMPFLVRENGWWTWRGTQQLDSDRALLRVHMQPDQPTRILTGMALQAKARPGPGSLHTIAIRELDDDTLRIAVLQESRIAGPSVVLPGPIDDVHLNGKPWAWRDGERVMLPNRVGEYRLERRPHAGQRHPTITSSSVDLLQCSYDTRRQVLSLQASPGTDPGAQGRVVVVDGGTPTRVEGGVIVRENELAWPDAGTAGRAAEGGTLVRLEPGTVEIHFGR